jgi:light-harvesting complex I chlorophyll a/b binding protein 5
MAAVAGILTTELIGAGGTWWVPDASAHVANGAPTARVFAEAALMAVAESFRLKAFEASGPGSKAFDPAGMNSDANAVKEIKNGRLAMVAFVGFAVQALVTREGPIEGLFAHLASPFSHNIVGNIANLPNVIGK